MLLRQGSLSPSPRPPASHPSAREAGSSALSPAGSRPPPTHHYVVLILSARHFPEVSQVRPSLHEKQSVIPHRLTAEATFADGPSEHRGGWAGAVSSWGASAVQTRTPTPHGARPGHAGRGGLEQTLRPLRRGGGDPGAPVRPAQLCAGWCVSGVDPGAHTATPAPGPTGHGVVATGAVAHSTGLASLRLPPSLLVLRRVLPAQRWRWPSPGQCRGCRRRRGSWRGLEATVEQLCPRTVLCAPDSRPFSRQRDGEGTRLPTLRSEGPVSGRTGRGSHVRSSAGSLPPTLPLSSG